MAIDRFLIAPYSTGQQTNVKPWLIAEDAFESIYNAYVFRGRVRKRFGGLYMNGTDVDQTTSRLRINIATTDGAGAAAGTVPGTKFAVGQMFSIGTDLFTVVSSTPGPQPMLVTGIGSGTYNISNGAYTFAGAPIITPIFFYPSTPVMGLLINETATRETGQLIAFDQQFAYQFIGGAFNRLGTAIWTGSDSQFFWGTGWQNIVAGTFLFFVTNFNAADNIKYWDESALAWTTIAPLIDGAGSTLLTARLLVNFGNRLIALNTIENIVMGMSSQVIDFPQRARWSSFSDATTINAWKTTVSPTAGFLDAPTDEQITSAYFIKNRLIVFFENSTWELVYTGNTADPFIWQRINSELGSESTFSTVPFDKVLLTVGDVGIHACNGANVERIDDKIPDEVFSIHNGNDGIFRVYGIRDYFVEMVYWALPDVIDSPTYPNRVLVYNYKTGAWAFNDDTITAFGYFNNPLSTIWSAATQLWDDATELWGSGQIQSAFRQVCAGNQQGFVFLVAPNESQNAPVMQITNVNLGVAPIALTVINHNLIQGDYIKIENAVGLANINNLIFEVNVQDANTIRLLVFGAPVTGTYLGGGTIRRVTPIDILTKQFNFYEKSGRNALINKAEFLVESTDVGECTVDFLVNFNDEGFFGKFGTEPGVIYNAIPGTNILQTFPYTTANSPILGTEEDRPMLWHPIYFNGEGQTVQLHIYLQFEQVLKFTTDPSGTRNFVADEPFEMNAMMIFAQPTTSIFQ